MYKLVFRELQDIFFKLFLGIPNDTKSSTFD
jgi:hypothetical protein